MPTGFYISGALHAAFIAFLLFGGLFVRDRLPPVAVTDVTVLTEAEFAALTPPAAAPEIATEAPEPLAPQAQAAPDVPDEDAAPERAEPSVTDAPAAPLVPNVPVTPEAPDTNVLDAAPVLDRVEDGDDLAAIIPDAAPRPAERVAPEAAPPPPPDVQTAPEAQPDVATEAPEIVEEAEESEAAAPEEATTEIITEADERPNLAPTISQRPRSRPVQRVAAAEPDPEEVPDEPVFDVNAARDAAVNQALAGVVSDSAQRNTQGTPMTAAEKDALRLSVQRCWVIDLGSEAAEVEVVLGFSLNPDGNLIDGSLRMIDATAASDRAVRAAYEAARRAVLRCGAAGFDLPREKYASWREVEITFSIEEVRG